MKLVGGFFFSWDWHAAQTVGSSNSVELTDTHRETKTLDQQALHFRTGSRRMALAMFRHTGEDIPAQFDWVPVPSLSQGTLAFALHSLEQPVDRRSMHGENAAHSCV